MDNSAIKLNTSKGAIMESLIITTAALSWLVIKIYETQGGFYDTLRNITADLIS
jgi:hypothetical protein